MQFSKKLIKLRTEKKLTQQELGDKLGLSGKVISRWERGVSEPTLSEMKKLCKIFKCDYSEFIDNKKKEDVKEETKEVIKVNLDKHDSKVLKELSKAIAIVSKVLRILLYIIIPFVVIGLFVIPIFISRIKTDTNSIAFEDFFGNTLSISGENISLQGNYVVKYKNEVINNEFNLDIMKHVQEVFNNVSPARMIICFELSLIIVLFSVIVSVLIFKYLEILFNNIYEGKVFIDDNTNYLRKIGYFLLMVLASNIVVSYIIELIIRVNINSGINVVDILFVLGLFCLVYIFKYGSNIQKKIDGKIY